MRSRANKPPANWPPQNKIAAILMVLLGVHLPLSHVALANDEGDRPRARDVGIGPGNLPTGTGNAITDVPGVLVGQVTLKDGHALNTGVTAILPHGGNLYQEKVPAGVAIGNAYGKLMGSTQIKELGEIETPVVLTNTLSVPMAAEGVLEWTLSRPGNEDVGSVNAVVGETNDGYLNDIRARRVRPAHAVAAIEAARSGPVQEGAVGAGAGTVNFSWKGGIGTSSRRLRESDGGFIVGVIVQTNYGGALQILGTPVANGKRNDAAPVNPDPDKDDGSVMIVVATNAPLSDRNLERLARRSFFGIARTGSFMSNGSGDFAIAFSTAIEVRRIQASNSEVGTIADLPNNRMTPLFQAVIEATEEAVYNALFRARTVIGYKGTIEAIRIDEVLARLRHARVLE